MTVSPLMLGYVLAWLPDAHDRARVIDALRRNVRLEFVDRTEDLFAHLEASISAPDVVILPTVDESGHTIERAIKRIGAGWPRIAIVVRATQTSQSLLDFRALTAAGAHQFLVSPAYEGAALRAVLERAWRTNAGEQVMRRLAPVIPAALHPMVETIVENPAAITSINALAEWMGVHRRTLVNRCEKAGPLQPTDVLGWARIALVAYHLENSGCTVETIAMDLAYPSTATLRNTIKRYTGLTASELRRRGPVGSALAVLAERLSA